MEDSKNKPKWTIGSIVALKTHFYSNIDDKDIVIISGEPQLISPLMIIIEALKEIKPSIADNSTTEFSENDNYQYKCMWFSQNKHQFEEAWISSKLLKIVSEYKIDEEAAKEIKQFGSIVEFKTSDIELGKKKSTLKQFNDYSNNKNYSITSHLAFVSPVMQVIGDTKCVSKEPLTHHKTKEKLRFISSILIKCKYYNPNSDKFSEVLIPIEALELIKSIDEKTMEIIKDSITNNKYLILKDKNSYYDKTIVKPEKINFRNGKYYLSYIDYLNGKSLESLISKLEIVSVKEKFFTEELPKFNFSGKLTVTKIDKESLTELINRVKEEKDKIISIQYDDINEVITKRAIRECLILPSVHNEKNIYDKEIAIDYLKAFCHLRKDYRYFRIDRIRELKVLDLH